jgi:hypothetical protein
MTAPCDPRPPSGRYVILGSVGKGAMGFIEGGTLGHWLLAQARAWPRGPLTTAQVARIEDWRAADLAASA